MMSGAASVSAMKLKTRFVISGGPAEVIGDGLERVPGESPKACGDRADDRVAGA